MPLLGCSKRRKGAGPLTPRLPMIFLFILLHPCKCDSVISRSKSFLMNVLHCILKRGKEPHSLAWHSGSSQSRNNVGTLVCLPSFGHAQHLLPAAVVPGMLLFPVPYCHCLTHFSKSTLHTTFSISFAYMNSVIVAPLIL